MKTIITSMEPVTASVATPDDKSQHRTITGLALPWDKIGFSSAGQVAVPKGAVKLPNDLKRVKLWRDHSNASGSPVGYATSAEATEEGLMMSFTVGDTPDGDAALKDVKEGIRDALSVEIVAAQVESGKLIGGTLTSVALVPVPAFDDARVTAFTASFHDETPESPKEPPMTTPAPATAPKGTITTASRGDKAPITFARVIDTIAAVRSGAPRTDMLTAALADITRSGHPNIAAPEWLGELWQGNEFQREIVPTMATNKKLTSLKATGWRWTTKPTVDDYAGDKQEIPTNTPATEAVSLEVHRLAGGHDIDRAFFDFNDTAFIASYFRAMSESYAIQSDDRAAQFLVTEAEKNPGDQQQDLLRAAAKARQLVKKATRTEATSFLVNPDDMFELMNITTMDEPRYLKLVGVDPERFVSSEQVPAGKVIAYNKMAAEFRELAGSPIRVEAEHLSHGGRDAAVFGYYATFSPMPSGIVSVAFGRSS